MASDARSLRVLGFESFDAGSHRSVRESISRHSRHRWTWLTRPGRGWKWRMRLAALELVDAAAAAGGFDEPLDVMVATSLLSVADLRALVPARLREVPIVLYMHENQAAYPTSGQPSVDPQRDVHFALTNLTSILAADLVIWNSHWNRASFLDRMHPILRDASAVDVRGWDQKVNQRSRVIWPPVEPPPEAASGRGSPVKLPGGSGQVLHKPTRVAWPHRWEHDKGPDELLEIATRESDLIDLRWTILGWQFPTVPPALVELQRRFAGRIDHMGYEPDRSRYWELLARCDWVLSTALHEFFGVAVVEALLAGCLPWLPRRLSYPELLPPEAQGLSPAQPPSDPQRITNAILAHLEPALAPNAVARIDDAIEGVVGGEGLRD
ncbi:MAG: tRNA-queuosine alpha-mannosyltransferase domain-containing protein [Planctomycetota bacterium]|jgi:glycosyltransferase involved in cell wall biosynthesis